MRMFVNFDLATDPNIDHVLTQLRYAQAESQLPADVRNFGVTVQKSLSAPFMIVALNSPNGTRDAEFLANYAYINLSDALSRVPGISQVTDFRRGTICHANLGEAGPTGQAEHHRSRDHQRGEQPEHRQSRRENRRAAQSARAGIHLYRSRARTPYVRRKNLATLSFAPLPDGSIVRLRDVARIELGAADYDIMGRFNGKPTAVLALYQLPGSNAIEAAKGVEKLMAELKERFPADLDYQIPIDTTKAVTEGIREIGTTFWEALALVMLVVFVFLQGWRAALIPLLAVPVSLVGTFALFPLLGFSINTLSLFGLVLAIGLVVDDAIVVVEAVEHHIEEGMSPRDATLKAMEEVSGPVIAIAIILSAVFLPTVFIPGITGRLYQQFAVTIAISVLISAFNALTLSPALSALLLRPKKEAKGPLGRFFNWFNRGYRKLNGRLCRCLRGADSQVRIRPGVSWSWWRSRPAFLAKALPSGFLPEEDQGFLYRERPASVRRVAGTHGGGLQTSRGHRTGDAGSQGLHDRRRIQPAQFFAQHL